MKYNTNKEVVKLQGGKSIPGKRTQKLFDNVTSKILQNDSAKNKNISSTTGIWYEQPLKDIHPGLDLALMYAQPGNIVVKAFAPSMAKGFVEGVKSGDTQQALLSMLVPGGNVTKSLAKSNELARILNKEVKNIKISDSPVTQNILAGKLGWAPRQNKVIWHNSETPILKLESTFPAWDIVKRDAPLGHVWGTGVETKQGFIGARPFHLRSTQPVEMNKPMVQLNEAIGDSKNAVRNEILKYVDQSGADAINFSNIKDNTLSNQDVYAIFKDVNVKPKLLEAEHLGIPKGERSNPKALEDPQYWGYQQWNDRYNSAVESGDIKEGRRLINLHEARNAPDTKVKGDQFHGTNNREFNEMNSTKNPGRTVGAGSKLSNFFSDVDTANAYLIDAQGMGTVYNGPGRIIRARLNIKNPYIFDYEGAKFNGTGGSAKKYNYLTKTFTDVQNSQLKYFPTESDFIKQWRSKNKYLGEVVNGKDYVYTESKVKPTIAELVDNIDRNIYDGAIIKNITELDTPIVDYVTFTPNQVKLSNVVTYDDYGNMIPIVKRHNYHIKDMRFKQGGILKAQKGLLVLPQVVSKQLRRVIPAKALTALPKIVAGNQAVFDPGQTFLLDYDRQEKIMNDNGYHKAEDDDYGLVRSATSNLQKYKQEKIPIYQIGEDDANKSQLEQIYIGYYGDGLMPDYDGSRGLLKRAGQYPYNIYKDKVSNKYYFQAYDLNDYGKHKENYEGKTYGSKQWLAEMYDIIGSPFVQRTGIFHLPQYDNLPLPSGGWKELHKQGGILKGQNGLSSFEEWYKTVPKDYNDTTNYNLRRAYQLVPFKDLEKWRKNPEKNHLNSVYKNEDGDYEFLKLPGHPTLNLELDWYNKADKFKKKYQLDTTGTPWKYVRILKGQLGLPNLPINLELVRNAYNKVDSFFNPISKWDEEHGTTSKASSGMLTLINPEAWVGIDEATLTAQHFGKNGQIARELEPFKGQLGSVGGQKLPPKIKPKKSPNEARKENLKKLANRSFNGDEKKALDFLISKRKK